MAHWFNSCLASYYHASSLCLCWNRSITAFDDRLHFDSTLRPLSAPPPALHTVLSCLSFVCPSGLFIVDTVSPWTIWVYSPWVVITPDAVTSAARTLLHCCVLTICGVFVICFRNWVIQLHFDAQHRVVTRPEGSWINSSLSGAVCFVVTPHGTERDPALDHLFIATLPAFLPSFLPGFFCSKAVDLVAVLSQRSHCRTLKHPNAFHADPQWRTQGNILMINFKLNFLPEVGCKYKQSRGKKKTQFHHLFPRLLPSCKWIVTQQTLIKPEKNPKQNISFSCCEASCLEAWWISCARYICYCG